MADGAVPPHVHLKAPELPFQVGSTDPYEGHARFIINRRGANEPQPIADFFNHVVQGTIHSYLDNVTAYPVEVEAGRSLSIEALALQGRAYNGQRKGYHYVYNLFDETLPARDMENNLGQQNGIVIANPRVSAPYRGVYPAEHTVRHYSTINTGVVLRQDFVGKRRVFRIPLIGSIEHPLMLCHPDDDWVTQEFKADVQAILKGKPLRPSSNTLPQTVHITTEPEWYKKRTEHD